MTGLDLAWGDHLLKAVQLSGLNSVYRGQQNKAALHYFWLAALSEAAFDSASTRFT